AGRQVRSGGPGFAPQRCDEAIAPATHGLDEAYVRIAVAQCRANLTDRDRYDAPGDECVAPDRLQDGVDRDDLAGAKDEAGEDCEVSGGEGDQTAVAREADRCHV